MRNICSQKHNSSVIRQKGKSQNGNSKKTKHHIFSEKRTFLTPKKCSFFGEFGVLCFLVTPDLRFALLANCRRYITALNSVQIRSFFWSVFSYIQSECREIRSKKNSGFGYFSSQYILKKSMMVILILIISISL